MNNNSNRDYNEEIKAMQNQYRFCPLCLIAKSPLYLYKYVKKKSEEKKEKDQEAK
ncbi:hypothetical protein [Anaerosphaera multitolerans]|uniref:hypothetical protein n=1 Tax=Anaerosphaera multitolerans TaxID=2487351 RepID=UPI0013E2C31B|nr:hypothetical protein [Anaerosphaera multitolerans]